MKKNRPHRKSRSQAVLYNTMLFFPYHCLKELDCLFFIYFKTNLAQKSSCELRRAIAPTLASCDANPQEMTGVFFGGANDKGMRGNIYLVREQSPMRGRLDDI